MIKMILVILLTFVMVYFTVKETKKFVVKYNMQFTPSQRKNILYTVVLLTVAAIITALQLFLVVVLL